MSDESIIVYPISEVKTLMFNDKFDAVLLRIRGGNTEAHYSLRIEDLNRLGKQLCNDAMLLAEHNL